MTIPTGLTEHILDLERRLLDPTIRQSKSDLLTLLADDFLEIGQSGRIYDRKTVLDHLQETPGFDGPRTIESFHLRLLSTTVAQATYRIKETGTLRSSIWLHKEKKWQMVFNQGTPSKEG